MLGWAHFLDGHRRPRLYRGITLAESLAKIICKFPCANIRAEREGDDEPSPGGIRDSGIVSQFNRLNCALHPTRFFGQTRKLQGDSFAL